MKLIELIKPIPAFAAWPHPKKMLLFGWFMHIYEGKERFASTDVRLCYEQCFIEKPSSIGPFLKSLKTSRPKRLLEDRKGLYLPHSLREQHDTQFGKRDATVSVHQILDALVKKVGAKNEQVFLEEAIVCFRHQAFRAAIVMTWNLAYDHLRELVRSHHLTAFNSQFPKVCPKKRLASGVATTEDFNEFKESEFLEVCRGANIIDGNLHKILDEKLARRNIAAHPSTVKITQLQAEDFISDLVNNVVLRLV